MAAILWGNRLIYFSLFTACAREPCCLAGLGLSFVCPELTLPSSCTAALEATLKILISGCFYGRWNRIWVRLKQLKISSFALDNIWINFRLNRGMQLFLSKQRRGWWDFDFSCPCNRIGTGDGAAGVVVCSSFTSELCPPELFSPVVLHLPMVSLPYQSRVWLWPGTFSPCQSLGPSLWAALDTWGKRRQLILQIKCGDAENIQNGGKRGSLGLWREPGGWRKRWGNPKGRKRLGKPWLPPSLLPMCILTLPSQGVTNNEI